VVAVPDTDTVDRVSPRVLRMLQDMQLPGDREDHAWIGERIQEAAQKLSDRFPHEFGQDLLVSGLALDLGLDPSSAKDLEGWCFPEPWLHSVPALLQCGFPQAAWRLVETNVLRMEPQAADARYAWKVDLKRIHALATGTYELGEDLVVRLLMEGMMGVAHGREKDTRFRVVAHSLPEARDWVGKLKRSWSAEAKRPLLVAG
jgi:hypothetical protein